MMGLRLNSVATNNTKGSVITSASKKRAPGQWGAMLMVI